MAKNFMSAMVNTKASTPAAMYSQTEKIKKDIIILEEIKRFIPPLLPDEKKQLEQNILEFGCKDALTVWETTLNIAQPNAGLSDEPCFVLIDGHNRYEICQKFNIDFKIVVVEFANFDKVFDYMIDHQLGRRNLSVEQISYFRGLKYNSLKNSQIQRGDGGKFTSNPPSGQNVQTVDNTEETPQNDDQNQPSGQNVQTVKNTEETSPFNEQNQPSGQNVQTVKKASLSEQLAEQFNVNEKTIRRDADFAKGLDRLPAEIKNDILQGKSPVNKSTIIEIGKLKESDTLLTQIDDLLTSPNVSVEVAKLEVQTNKNQDKLIQMVKTINRAEDCDKLIEEILKYKKKLMKN
ncbi:hypothetical protein LV89_03665 [Arcicella aurantiaca]|uniref:ParB-like nuclease family protein n=1 Tax=Arcicella aurantiaca TaxID=591202 RepID=A0A316DWT0_9BACT|nr:hypothetical protein [Arcicella aurantiaca]PWK21639.1 hypothetical protein LV89_03665 [Arcicella aurantiaca]